MALPTMDGQAIDYNQIPGFTCVWSAGYGPAGSGFSTRPATNPAQIDQAKAPESGEDDSGA